MISRYTFPLICIFSPFKVVHGLLYCLNTIIVEQRGGGAYFMKTLGFIGKEQQWQITLFSIDGKYWAL